MKKYNMVSLPIYFTLIFFKFSSAVNMKDMYPIDGLLYTNTSGSKIFTSHFNEFNINVNTTSAEIAISVLSVVLTSSPFAGHLKYNGGIYYGYTSFSPANVKKYISCLSISTTDSLLAFIATFDQVYLLQDTTKTPLTFQIILLADEYVQSSYILVNYASLNPFPAQTPHYDVNVSYKLFYFGKEVTYVSPWSGTIQVKAMGSLTNCNKPGQWLYEVNYAQHSITPINKGWDKSLKPSPVAVGSGMFYVRLYYNDKYDALRSAVTNFIKYLLKETVSTSIMIVDVNLNVTKTTNSTTTYAALYFKFVVNETTTTADAISYNHAYDQIKNRLMSNGSITWANRRSFIEAEFLLTDQDECGLNLHGCSVNAECITIGGYFNYACKCLPGYSGDGYQCRKIVPGNILQDTFIFKYDENDKTKLIVRFGKPVELGTSENITFHLTCNGDALNVVKTWQTAAIVTDFLELHAENKCSKNFHCSIRASNVYGYGNKTTKSFHDTCKSSEMAKSVIIGLSVGGVIVFIFVMVIGVVGIKIWKEKENFKEKFNDLDSTVRNPYVDVMELQQFINKMYREEMSKQGKIGDVLEEEDIKVEDNEELECTSVKPEITEYPLSELKIIKELGKGEFGVVHKAEAYNICGKKGISIVAVKQIKNFSDEKEVASFQLELEMMRELKYHKHVVRMLGFSTKVGELAMVLELVEFGDLLESLRKTRQYVDKSNEDTLNTFLTVEVLLRYMAEISSGMDHLQQHGIVHRDLACRNVLLSSNKTCKIADLGLARHLDKDGKYEPHDKSKVPIRWTAPESMVYNTWYRSSDVWSFGIVMWEISTIGGIPYYGSTSQQVYNLVREGRRLKKPLHCDTQLYQLFCDCWKEHQLRPSFECLHGKLVTMHRSGHDYLRLDEYVSTKNDYLVAVGVTNNAEEHACK